MATDIGTRIKRARERKRWTQRQLAGALQVNVKTVDNWENGRTSPRSSIGALEEVLGVSLGDEEAVTESVIDEKLGEQAAGFREAMRRLYGPDADRQLRLVEEALSQPPAADAAGLRAQSARQAPR